MGEQDLKCSPVMVFQNSSKYLSKETDEKIGVYTNFLEILFIIFHNNLIYLTYTLGDHTICHPNKRTVLRVKGILLIITPGQQL